jgi:hypothetical protein
MPRNRDPFGLALESLRTRAQDGAFAPGQPIVIMEEARRLKLSTTPVREALAWLCGEGMIERGPGSGYVFPKLDAGLVRDRLEFRLYCLMASLSLTTGLYHPDRSGSLGPVRATDVLGLFGQLVRRTANASLVGAFDRVGGQLRRVTDVESRVFDDVDAEASTIIKMEAEKANGTLARAIETYHRRRMDNAALLVLEIERQASIISSEA